MLYIIPEFSFCIPKKKITESKYDSTRLNQHLRYSEHGQNGFLSDTIRKGFVEIKFSRKPDNIM